VHTGSPAGVINPPLVRMVDPCSKRCLYHVGKMRIRIKYDLVQVLKD